MRVYLGHIVLLGTITLLSCAPQGKEWIADETHRVYRPAIRQLPPDPVYNRMSKGYLPEVLPSKEVVATERPLVLPIIHLSLHDDTLDQAAHLLADSARYGAYCSSSIADKKINLEVLGTIDELADEIAKVASIKTVIDHVNGEVRFLSLAEGITPEFPEAESKLPSQKLDQEVQ